MQNTVDNFPIHFPSDISEKLLGKKAIVTGGTGMIGREVVRLLLDHGCSVTSISLDDLVIDPRANYVKGDLSELNFCLDISSDMDFVFHVAGIKGSVVVTKEKPASFFVPLLMMNTNMLEAARRNKVDKVLYTSSIGAYSPTETFIESKDDLNIPPMDMFPGWAKRMAEMQIDAYRIQYGTHGLMMSATPSLKPKPAWSYSKTLKPAAWKASAYSSMTMTNVPDVP